MAARAIAGVMLLAAWTPCVLAQTEETPRAFDGHRGFGAELDGDDLRRLLQARRGSAPEFLAALDALEPELRDRMADLRTACSERNYHAILPRERRAEYDLSELHAAFRARSDGPGLALEDGDQQVGALAAMLLDDRFRARVRALAGWEVEARELRLGLAVLRATTDGFVVLPDESRAQVTVRVDLAASRLRAALHDLEVLPPAELDAAARRAREEAVARLLAAAPDEQRALLAAQADKVERMASMLFGARLLAQPEVAEAVADREGAWGRARELRAVALEYLPDTDHGAAARPEIAALRKHERIRLAGAAGVAGLAADPLDEVSAYAAARAEDFAWGPARSRHHFDRYLALRGIRAHDHRTLKGRETTAWEREALVAVQAP